MDTKSLFKLGYGMYVVTSKSGDRLNGQIANTAFQVTSEPPTLAVSINKSNLTWEYIRESKAFAVSVLIEETPLSFIGNFGFKSGREIDKLAGVTWKPGETGSPVVLDNANAYLEAKVVGMLDVGTHTIFVGEVVAAEVLSDKPSMTYAFYHVMKRGITPPAAPGYVKETPAMPATAIKYECSICGWIYDPEFGDPDGGIAPGTPFEQIPDDWMCPVCGATKDKFQRMV